MEKFPNFPSKANGLHNLLSKTVREVPASLRLLVVKSGGVYCNTLYIDYQSQQHIDKISICYTK